MKIPVDKHARMALARRFQAARVRHETRMLWYAKEILAESERFIAAPTKATDAKEKAEASKKKRLAQKVEDAKRAEQDRQKVIEECRIYDQMPMPEKVLLFTQELIDLGLPRLFVIRKNPRLEIEIVEMEDEIGFATIRMHSWNVIDIADYLNQCIELKSYDIAKRRFKIPAATLIKIFFDFGCNVFKGSTAFYKTKT